MIKLKTLFVCQKLGNIIYEKLKDFKKCYKADKIEIAVKLAKDITKKGKICILSPAASSYNSFKNFEEKGSIYKRSIKEL